MSYVDIGRISLKKAATSKGKTLAPSQRARAAVQAERARKEAALRAQQVQAERARKEATLRAQQVRAERARKEAAQREFEIQQRAALEKQAREERKPVVELKPEAPARRTQVDDAQLRVAVKEAQEAQRNLVEVSSRYEDRLASDAELSKAERLFESSREQLEKMLPGKASGKGGPPPNKRKVDTSAEERPAPAPKTLQPFPPPTIVEAPPKVLKPWEPSPTPPPKAPFPDLLPEDLGVELPTVREVEEAVEEAVDAVSKQAAGIPWLWVGVGVLAFIALKKDRNK